MATIGKDITRAVQELNEGNLVGIPTETVYGLAGNAFKPEVVTKIFEVKNRPSFDPLIVHVSSMKVLDKVVSGIPEKAVKLASNFWPGPLTLVLPKTDLVPDLVTSGRSTVAVRIPSHSMAQQLLSNLDFPLASPSANPFGYISPTCALHVQSQLGDLIPYILDGGDCQIGVESTILGFDQEQPVLYRPGGIPLEALEELVGPVAILNKSQPTSLAPGMLKSHYAPAKKLLIGNISKLIESYGCDEVGILSLKDSFNSIRQDHQIQLSDQGDLRQAAQNLFGSLRKLDSLNIKYIFAELVPEYGLGVAINDRLRRAAS